MTHEQSNTQKIYQDLDGSASVPAMLTVVSRTPHLTEREQETLHHLAAGYTSEQIAQKLFLSTETIVSHRKSLIKKLGVANIAAAIATAFRQKLIS